MVKDIPAQRKIKCQNGIYYLKLISTNKKMQCKDLLKIKLKLKCTKTQWL